MTQVSELIGDTSNQQWSEAQIQDRIQKAQEQFVVDTRALTDTQTFSIVSGTNTYDLSDDTFDIIRVGISGHSALKKFSKFDLDLSVGGDWSTRNGPPSHYFVDTTSTNKKLTLFPIPQGNDAGTNNLVAEYVKVPPILTGDSDSPLNGQPLLIPYLDALAYYAASQILFASNDQTQWAKGRLMLDQYRSKVSDCKEGFNALSQTTPLRMRLYGVGRSVNAR